MDERVAEKREARSQNETTVQTLGTEGDDVTVTCECGKETCAEQLTLAKQVYRKIRHQRTWYILAAGHELAARERVVLRQPEFVVVRG